MEYIKDEKSMVEVYSELLREYARKDPRICVVENDLSHADSTQSFMKEFPERFFNVGVAESNSICVSAGLAANGYIPFVASLVTFITRRCYDQLAISVAYSGLNVKVVGTRPGVTSEQNGGTHFGIADLGIMRNLPTFQVVDATDVTALKKLFPQVLETPHPVYFRFCGSGTRKIYDDDAEIILGKANTIREGKDATIIANDNVMVDYALDCADMLAAEGYDVGIVDMHTVKPIDADAILKAAKKGPILTAENNSIINGLGSAVAEVMAENGCSNKLYRFGIRDRFGVVGWKKDISEAMGVTAKDMAAAMKTLLK